MKRVIILTCVAAVAGWLGIGCDEPVPPVTKKRPHPRTNRVARVTTSKPRPVKLAKEIRPGTIAYLDAKNGFRDVTFGEPETKIAQLVEASRDEARQLKTCTRLNETMSLHGVPLERVEYKFFRGELYAVEIEWQVSHADAVLNRPPATDLSVRCASEYGPPRRHRMTKEGTRYIWRGQRVQLDLTESLLPGVADLVNGGWAIPPTTAGSLLIRNLALSRAAEAGFKSRPVQGSDGF